MKTRLIFGVLADIQFADTANGTIWYKPGVIRYFKESTNHVTAAFEIWNSDAINKPQFLLQLGDLIDGSNRDKDPKQSLEHVLNKFDRNIPAFHTIGKLR